MGNQASTFLFFCLKDFGLSRFFIVLGTNDNEQITYLWSYVRYGVGTLSCRTGISTLKKVSFSKNMRDRLIDFRYVIHNTR